MSSQKPITQTPAGTKTKSHTAGAFDIRNVIGALLGIYGLVLVIASFALEPGVNPDTNQPKNSMDNLWAGLAMLAVAVVFFVWTKLAPIRVVESVPVEEANRRNTEATGVEKPLTAPVAEPESRADTALQDPKLGKHE